MQVKSAVKAALQSLFPVLALHYRAYDALIRDKSSYLYSTGWMQSLRERTPMDTNGNPIPWMNFSVVSLLAARLTNDLNLFEFGSGYSTLFYASRVRGVTSVEYDHEWFTAVKARAPANVKLILMAKGIDGAYCRVIASTKDRYDVVIVDGRDRVNCLNQSVSMLSGRGVMILDDSHRDRYQAGLEFARASGFRAIAVEGLKATRGEMHRTTILYRENNCLGI